MIKSIIISLISIFFISGNGWAQIKSHPMASAGISGGYYNGISAITTPATASVVIFKGLSITNIKGLNFGNFAVGAGTVGIASNNKKAAEFEVTGEPQTEVKVTIPSTLINLVSGNASLSLNLYNPAYNTLDDQINAIGAQNNSLFSTNLGVNGTLFIWIGGEVNILPSTTPGTYNGTITVSVAYVNL